MSESTTILIDGEQLKVVLEESIGRCENKLVFISAYITQTAIDWLERYVSSDVDVHLVCRLQPSDIINGATQISALMTALEKGWAVSCLHSLHAKIYSIDDKEIYVGSANLTSNGLKIYGTGNLEACSNVIANEDNLRFITNIEKSSNKLNQDILQKMEDCVANKVSSIHLDKWPEGTLPKYEGIWVHDFFWFNPKAQTPQGNEKFHDLDLIGIELLDPQNKKTGEKILMSRCIQWLISKLEEQPEAELYFGSLTKLLHDELKDDPSPYRKDVKSLVQNLLSYCQMFLQDEIDISQPNHSQRVKLINIRNKVL